MKKLLLKTALCLIIHALCLTIGASAEAACDITDDVTFICTGINKNRITDNSIATHSSAENVSIEILSEQPMGGVYIKYNEIPTQGVLNQNTPVAQNGFIHEYIPLNSANSAKLFYENTDICDIQVFSVGVLPSNVQIWQKGDSDTDILLCATHSDDDQLFFAGLLPYYAKHIGANVRVAYFINHFDTYNRTHELLDGLWHCGITNYPDISPFPDGYSESIEGAQSYLRSQGYSYSDILEFQRSLINKYRPLVAVLHDFNGEYGHGAHMLNTKSFIEVCENAEESQYVPEKIYVHLYSENPITLPIDAPLESFGGKSAFQVSQEAFGFHKSQHWTWFYGWIYGKNTKIANAAQIKSYSPLSYGLYYTRVGEDAEKNDFLENITTYSQRKALAQRDADEQAQQEHEKTSQEHIEKEKREKERAEELTRIEEAARQENSTFIISVLIIFVFITIAVTVIIILINNIKKKR